MQQLDEKVLKMVNEFEEFMDDDFSTAKVLANMFELSSVINSIKDGHIKTDALSASTCKLVTKTICYYILKIFLVCKAFHLVIMKRLKE